MIREVQFLDFTNALIEGNKEKCTNIFYDIIHNNSTDIKEIYVELFQKSLYTIGSLWEKNELSVGDEHISSQIVETLIYNCSNFFKPSSLNGKKALIACIDKEFHKLGAKMASDIFEMNGWKTYFMGASTPTREILKAIETKKPHVIGLSFNFYMNLLKLFKVIEDIKKYFPESKIIIGGQGVKEEKETILSKHPDIFYFTNVKELDKYLKNYK